MPVKAKNYKRAATPATRQEPVAPTVVAVSKQEKTESPSNASKTAETATHVPASMATGTKKKFFNEIAWSEFFDDMKQNTPSNKF
ncbi:hypothetical protein [Paenibacillus sp. Soil724D2]|uniref:hypothetical protein n=1 Tax=Paenibacillus sp. (strain Soil724D2) TaxID=1736392 RepID=UPI000AF3B34B|nr:hypothetical protein [Paenibacillus sp. Soil724D2]